MEFRNQLQIEKWLREKNRHEFAVVLAARAALRGVAVFDVRISRVIWWDRISAKNARIMLFALRAAAAPWPCARYPSRCAEFSSATHAAAATGYITYSDFSGNASQSSHAAGGGFERAALAVARPAHAYEHAAHAVFDVARAAEIAGGGGTEDTAPFRAVFDTFSADATMLESGTTPADLAAMPLWLQGTPDSAAAAWKRLSSALRARNENWEVWINWYEACLAGRSSVAEPTEFACLKIPDAVWERGPKEANFEITKSINAGTASLAPDEGLFESIRAWLRGWRWSAVWGELRTAFKRENWVADLSESARSNWGIGGWIRSAAETAVRGKALTVGLWFGGIGLLLLLISVPPLVRVIADRNEALGDWFWPILGTAIGAYWFFGRGLGAIQSALSWSRISNDTHGKARWATLKELRRAALAPRASGIYIGRFLDKGAASDRVGYPGPVHLITIGPNNAGKGTGIIIPNLATLRRSIFIIDPKGEAAAITARRRAKFGPVKIINPFNVLADKLPYLKSCGFNPLAALDPGHDNFTDDCVGIAQALVKEGTGSNEAFFSGSAQDLVTALVMHEKIRNGKNASLANVRKMLTEPLAGSEKDGAIGLLKTILDMTESHYEPLRSKAGRFVRGTKSTMDVISTASNETRLLDSPALQRDLSGEAINWDSMKEEITTVYLILPSDRLETHANFLRLVVTSALRTLLRSPPSATLPPVLFMLDEFAQLGYLAPIENAMGIARGFGVQLWPFLQDLNQLHALYKDRWQTFIGARGVLTAFAPKDIFTADYLSRLCGNKTVIVESENVRVDSSVPGGGRTPQGVPLIRPEELMGMPAGQMLCFAEPVKHPFIAKAPGYWDTWFAHGLDDNPYHRG